MLFLAADASIMSAHHPQRTPRDAAVLLHSCTPMCGVQEIT